MVDFTTTRTIDITKMALDGLMMRQKAVMANTANVMSPDYNRKEVNFESQLKEMVEKDDLKQTIKEQNSIQYNPSSIDTAMNFGSQTQHKLTGQEARYLQSDIYSDYNPQVVDDTVSGTSESGNNVDMEKEIMDMAKVGTQYTILSNLEARSMKLILDSVKGTGS